MAITSLTPEEETVNEYEPFSITFTVAFDGLDESDPKIESVTVSGGYEKYYTVDIIDSDSTFVISGLFADVFNREMHYLTNPDRESKMVTRWADMPNDFYALYKYIGAFNNSIILDVTVNTNDGTETATIEVLNNWNVSNQHLSKYVALGKH